MQCMLAGEDGKQSYIEGLGKGWKIYELSSAGQQPNLRSPIRFSMQGMILNSVMGRLD